MQRKKITFSFIKHTKTIFTTFTITMINDKEQKYNFIIELKLNNVRNEYFLFIKMNTISTNRRLVKINN
jgi:hypothetical protein